MSAVFQRVSKITAKGQTTVPKVVRDVLGVEQGGTIAYHIDENGAVRLTRPQEAGDEAAIDAFLAFLSNDIKQRPDKVTALSRQAAAELRDLTDGLETDLESGFDGATPL